MHLCDKLHTAQTVSDIFWAYKNIAFEIACHLKNVSAFVLASLL